MDLFIFWSPFNLNYYLVMFWKRNVIVGIRWYDDPYKLNVGRLQTTLKRHYGFRGTKKSSQRLSFEEAGCQNISVGVFRFNLYSEQDLPFRNLSVATDLTRLNGFRTLRSHAASLWSSWNRVALRAPFVRNKGSQPGNTVNRKIIQARGTVSVILAMPGLTDFLVFSFSASDVTPNPHQLFTSIEAVNFSQYRLLRFRTWFKFISLSLSCKALLSPVFLVASLVLASKQNCHMYSPC